MWALLDRFRRSHGEHWRPIGEPASMVESAAPAVEGKRRSPFAPKEKEVGK